MAAIEDLLFTPHILTNIFSFTDETIISQAREVCKSWANILCRVAIFKLPYWRGDGVYVDADRMMHVFPAFTGDVLELNISFKAKDQGWGNKKGRIWLVVNEPARWVANTLDTCNPFATVEHSWREDKATLSWDKDSLVKHCIAGNFIQAWVHVGGGGGHSLMVKDFKVIVKYKPTTFELTPTGNSMYSGCNIM